MRESQEYFAESGNARLYTVSLIVNEAFLQSAVININILKRAKEKNTVFSIERAVVEPSERFQVGGCK